MPKQVRRPQATSAKPLLPSVDLFSQLCYTEIDLLWGSADDGAKASFEEATAAWDAAVQAVPWAKACPSDEKEGPTEMLALLEALIRQFWRAIATSPHSSKIELPKLAAATSVAALVAFFLELCSHSAAATRAFRTGGMALGTAIVGFHGKAFGSRSESNGKAEDEAAASRRRSLFEWWADEVCTKALGVTDVFGSCVALSGAPTGMRALAIAAACRDKALVQWLLERGQDPNGDMEGHIEASPGAAALAAFSPEILQMLMDAGLDPCKPYLGGWTLMISAFRLPPAPADARSAEEGARLKADRLAVLNLLVDRCPDVLTANNYVLVAALRGGDADAVDLALSRGAKPSFGKAATSTIEGLVREAEPVPPSIIDGLRSSIRSGSPEVLSVLVEKHGLLNEEALGRCHPSQPDAFVMGLVGLACTAFKQAPGREATLPDYVAYAMGPGGALPFRHNPAALRLVQVVLATPFRRPFLNDGANAILTVLYQRGEKCLLTEEGALTLLKVFHAAGWDVGDNREGSDASKSGRSPALLQLAAGSGQISVVDWAIQVLGQHPDGTPCNELCGTPLMWALRHRHMSTAVHLLKRYNAEACYPGRQSEEQPIMTLLFDNKVTDADRLMVLQALTERDRHLLTCVESLRYQPAGLPLPQHPVGVCAIFSYTACLLHLLTSDVPMAKDLADCPLLLGGPQDFQPTPAQYAAQRCYWPVVSIFLQHAQISVLRTGPGGFDIVKMLQNYQRKGTPVPRSIQTMVTAAATRERQAAKALESGGAGASGASSAAASAHDAGSSTADVAAASASGAVASNAFEDPSLRPVAPMTEKERKQKEKKKRAKKKAKAKKRQATRAGAGEAAGEAPASSSDESSDDDEEPFEEPDDNLVDSRFAPSVDAMFAAMGLGPGGAPLDETASKGKE